MKRLLSLLFALSLPVLFLSGCWEDELPAEEQSELFPLEEEASSSTEDNSLPASFSLPYNPEQSLDPITCPDGIQQTVGSLLFEGLFHLDPQLEPQPVLCSSWVYDPDALTYTLQLKNDVKFSDGSLLTGKDVTYTLQRAKNSVRYGTRLSQISHINASDHTVTLTLSYPNTRFPALLDIPIVKAGTEKNAAPIGTGPYLLSFDDSIPQLISNQIWWQGDHQPVDRIPLAEAPDWDTTLYRFTSRDVQLITANLIGKEPITATGNILFQDADTTTFQFIGCNTLREPLNDPALRKALSISFNRSTIINAFLSGHGNASQFPVSPISPLYPVDLEQRYSKEAFSEMLSQSAYTSAKSLTLLVNSENPFKVSIAEFIAKAMTDGGVRVVVKALPWDEYTTALANGSFDLYYGEIRLTADWNLQPLLGTGGSLNYGRWSNAQTDQLLAAYASAEDPSAAMESLCRQLQNQAPIFPVCFTATSVLMHPNVLEGLCPTAAEPFYNLNSCRIHLKK